MTVVLVCSLLLSSPLFAQDVVILPFNAPKMAVVTSLQTEKAVSELTTSFIRAGYSLDITSLGETQFKTQPREVVVAEDLEYKVHVKHTVSVQEGTPLATVHIETVWNYGGLNKPVDSDPQSLAEYKRRYIPVYSNRIRLYIDAFVSEFDYVLLAHPLGAKP